MKTNIPTYVQFIKMIENDEIKVVGDKNNVIEYYYDNIEFNKKKGKDISDFKIANASQIHDGILQLDESFCLITGEPPVLICHEGIISCFVFGDVVICHGYDSILCYNIKTGEHKKNYL